MSTFDDRENAFEAKFAHDADMQFRAEARRDKLVGLWAADLLGKSGDAATDYAASVIKADMAEAGDEDVYRKLFTDIGHLKTEAEIRAKMRDMLIEAKSQLATEF